MTQVRKSFFEQHQLTIWACTILVSLFGTAWKYNENLRDGNEKLRSDILLISDRINMLQYQIDELKGRKTASKEDTTKQPPYFSYCAILPKQIKLNNGETNN